MPPTDAEFETIHYTITAHGTLRVPKDPNKKKSHKHRRRRHRKKRDSNGGEESGNEGTETRLLHAHMTPGPLHAPIVTNNAPIPAPQQHVYTTAMHMPETRAAPQGIAAPQVTPSKQGIYRRPRAGTIFPLLSWDEIWAEEEPELPGSNSSSQAEKNLHAPTAAPAQARAIRNVQKPGQGNEIDTRRKQISAESLPWALAQPPSQLTHASQDSGSSVGVTAGASISLELPIRTRGRLQNQVNDHGRPAAGSSPQPLVPPPHRIMPRRLQTLGPLLLSVQVQEHDEEPLGNDAVEYEISGQEADQRGKTFYRLQERCPGGSWPKPKNSTGQENVNQIELTPTLQVKSENDPPRNQGLTRYIRKIKLCQSSKTSSKSVEYGQVQPSVRDSTSRQGPQLKKSSGLHDTTLTVDQRTMDINTIPPHNSLTSLQTQRPPKDSPVMNSTLCLPPSLYRPDPLEEPMPNKSVTPAQTTPTRDATRFGESSPSFSSMMPIYGFDSSSQVTQTYSVQAEAVPDDGFRRRRPVLQYSDFDLQSSSSDGSHSRRYPSVPSFDTMAFQSPPVHRTLPRSPNTTPQRAVMATEMRGYQHGIGGIAHDGASVVRVDKAKPINLVARNSYPHVVSSSAGSVSYTSSNEGALQESPRGNINTPNTWGHAFARAPQALVPTSPTRPPKGPAPAFEGIVDLDPGVTLFNTATGVVKSDISPKVALGDSKLTEKMLQIWNRKTSDDHELRGMCKAEMRRLRRE